MRIGVCIPCTGNHLKYLEKCIKCIKNQTKKPDVISISISSYGDQQLVIDDTIPVVLQVTREPKCASENRNIAASRIYNDVDILSFIDVDDFMHPQKIQQVYKYFTENDADIFLHEFLEYPKKDYLKFNENKFAWPTIEGKLCDYKFELIRERVCGYLYLYDSDTGNKVFHHNAHISYKKSVWEDLKWPENYKFLGEDSEYNYQLFKKGYKYIVSKDKLSLYTV